MKEKRESAGPFDSEKTRIRVAVEKYLGEAFAMYPETEVRKVAEYTTLGGGHRWRAIVAIAAGQIFDRDALNIALPAAAAIELAQACTLVLDDLPSMDDAKLRRGKPCAHLVFPDWAVDMAPSFLLSMAYEISLSNPLASADRRCRAAVALSRAGLDMIAGQVMDLTRGNDFDVNLMKCSRLKAGAFYAASVMVGGILCGAEEQQAKSLYNAGLNLGLSYQILDDVADVTADVSEIGKEPFTDANKYTVTDWLGVGGARKKANEFRDLALTELTRFGSEADFLRSLVCEASWKTY